MAEIEFLVAELQGKVIRYALFRSSEKFSHPGGISADWMPEALEDIAATALDIELASREGLLRMMAVHERDLIIDVIEPRLPKRC
ncbi:hypothetical protein [Arthrobacter sp. UYCu712]|uniref:hypothetical protein n=1 Tax=Arthrobacter sp. UYCu712 TaxID=3156340 RepID=UPI00339316D3